MDALIAYGTTEGQTGEIAKFISDRLMDHGIDSTLIDLEKESFPPDPGSYGLAIIAASLHGGRYQTPVIAFAKKQAATLNRMPTLFVSVSLSALSTEKEDLDLLHKLNADFCRETGWTPKQIHCAAGAIRFSHYDFLKSWVLKYIAVKKGLPSDMGQDHVFTDWGELGNAVDGALVKA